MNVHEVAEAAGITAETVRHHHKVATKERREGIWTVRMLPEPAGQIDGANVWDDDEIREWIAARRTPAKRGAIPKSEMRAILTAAENGQIDQIITIAERNLE